jgi:hypothetical protein
MTPAGRGGPPPSRPYVDAPLSDPERARRAAVTAADRWGLPQPELLRISMNAIFAAGSAVLRASTPSVDACHSIELAETLLAAGLRVARPLRSGATTVDGVSVTCWERIESTGAPIDWSAVGAMVRSLHAIDPGEVPAGYPVPTPASFPWWHFEELLEETAAEIDEPALEGIRRAIERWSGWERFGDTVLCHGDVHPGNVMMSPEGPVLIDWDLLCAAPPAWDHAPLMTFGGRWAGTGHEYQQFAAGYGRSMRGDPRAEGFAELRLVAATLMRVRAGARDAAAMVEARRRLRFWAGDPDAPRWQAQ